MEKLSKLSRVSFRRFLFVSLLVVGISIFSSMRINAIIIPSNPPSYSSLTPHDPIYISYGIGFEAFPGSGTADDPYLIDGYNITTTDGIGISITYATKYFIIRNCYIDANERGIYIRNAATGITTIINNTCNDSWVGIYLRDSSSSTVANNTCTNNGWRGIRLWDSGSSIVTNNKCNNNGDDGIKLDTSGSSIVANNTCINNGDDGIKLDTSGSSIVTNNKCSNNGRYGIYLEYSGSSIVSNNNCSNNVEEGLYLRTSASSTVTNNTVTNCGLDIREYTINAYLSYTVEDNWVNGKKLGFYISLNSTTIAEPIYGQLILVDCTNVTVRDQILNNATTGLFLHSCTSSVIINNTCNNNNIGIYLYFSVSSAITNNTCNNNIWEGIFLSFSDSASITYNTCNSNNYYGIWLKSSGSSTVANNKCSNNGHYGIYLSSSDFCVVTYNLLLENEEYGVYLRYDSYNNLIHYNTFVDNNLGGTSQAYDDGANNYWYDLETLEGNYWSDYIGEGSYPIDGPSNSEDLYPLDDPTVEYSTVEIQVYFTFTLLILVVPLLLTKLLSRKTLKTA